MLYLYHGISPNDKLHHFYFQDVERYLDMLDNNSRISKQINLDNYRINTNIIKVKIDANLTEEDADKITYATEVRRNTSNVITYFRAYFVNKIEIQSGYAVLTCNVDLWASYIYKASIYRLYITRTNKKLDNWPIYDDIKAVLPTEYRGFVDSNGATNGLATPDYTNYYQYARRYCLVLVINYNAKQNLTGSDYISTTCCVAVDLETLRNKMKEGISDTTTDPQEQAILNMNVVRLAQDFAGGVYGISASLGHNDANVINAYIVPTKAINNTGFSIMLSSISLLRNGRDIALGFAILGHTDFTEMLYIRNPSPNRQIYFGKVHGGLKLNRVYSGDYCNVYIRIIISASSVEIIALQGNNQEDITDAFMLTITNNVSQTTPLRRIATAITQTGKATQAVTKGYENSGATGAIGAGLTSLASLVGGFSIDSKIRGDGDALMTFGSIGGNYVEIPFKATYFLSTDSEELKVMEYGATLEIRQLTSLNYFFEMPYLIPGTAGIPYIKADAIITQIPKEASDYIANEFAKGIYLYSLLPSE